MSNWQYCNIVPTKQFRSANALPRELGLYTQDGELYLSAAPVAETKLCGKKTRRFLLSPYPMIIILILY